MSSKLFFRGPYERRPRPYCKVGGVSYVIYIKFIVFTRIYRILRLFFVNELDVIRIGHRHYFVPSISKKEKRRDCEKRDNNSVVVVDIAQCDAKSNGRDKEKGEKVREKHLHSEGGSCAFVRKFFICIGHQKKSLVVNWTPLKKGLFSRSLIRTLYDIQPLNANNLTKGVCHGQKR